MKLSKNEQDILAVERFFKEIHQKFSHVEFISVYFQCIDHTPSHYQPKKNYFPLKVKICQDGKTCEYEWKPGTSDDEYPLYDKFGESLGFHEMRNFIKEKLPEAFKGKRIYKEERYFGTNNIGPILDALKQKMLVTQLNNDLPINEMASKPKIKI